jgi:hypothetical protein
MSESSKIPNSSHKILNQILHGIFFSKCNADAELWIGSLEITWDYKNVLYLKLDNLFNDDLITANVPHDKLSSIDEIDTSKSWDLIFIESSFGRTQEQFKSIAPILNNLSQNGSLLYLFPHLSALQLLDNKGILKENNVYPSSVLQLPKGFYGNLAGLEPILVSFEKQKPFNLVCFIQYKEDEYGSNIGWFVQRHKSGWSYENLEELEFHKKNNSRGTNYLIDELIYERFQEDNDLELGIEEDLHEFP